MPDANEVGRTSELTEIYTNELSSFVDIRLPALLDNAEYVARCTAMMIALNRNLARAAAAIGETNGVGPEQMMELVAGQFVKNYTMSMAVLQGQGAGQVLQ